jgi:rubrerythrin
MPVDSRKSFFESLDVKTRRDFLKAAAMAGVSTSVLFGGPAIAFAADDKKNDVDIMNIALGLEHQAIAAYTVGAGLLSDKTKPVAVGFLDQHKQHRDALTATIKSYGGKPVAAKSDADYKVPDVVKGFGFTLDEGGVLKTAEKLETQAAQAYYGVLLKLKTSAVIGAAMAIMCDESQHVAVLRHALGNHEPLRLGPFAKG